MKRYSLWFALSVLLVGLVPQTGFAATITTLTSLQEQQGIDFVNAHQIMVGSEDGQFHPAVTLSRCELVKVALLASHTSLLNVTDPLNNLFPDLNPDNWCRLYAIVAYQTGVLSGYPDGTFKPNNKVTQIEALKILLNSTHAQLQPARSEAGGYADLHIGDWWTPYVQYAVSNHVVPMHNGNNYGIGDQIRRGDVAYIIWQLLKSTDATSTPVPQTASYGQPIATKNFEGGTVVQYCDGAVHNPNEEDVGATLPVCIGQSTLLVRNMSGVTHILDQKTATTYEGSPVLLGIQAITNISKPFVLVDYPINYCHQLNNNCGADGVGGPNNYTNIAFDMMNLASQHLNNYPPNAASLYTNPLGSVDMVWNSDGSKGVYMRKTCGGAGCESVVLMGYNRTTDHVQAVTTEVGTETPTSASPNRDTMGYDLAYWSNIQFSGNNAWSVTLTDPSTGLGGFTRTINFTF